LPLQSIRLISPKECLLETVSPTALHAVGALFYFEISMKKLQIRKTGLDKGKNKGYDTYC